MMSDSPEQAVKLVDDAFNRGDLDGVLNFYEADAVVVREPGRLVRGHAELRDFFTEVMQPGAHAEQLQTSIIEADGIALFLSRWTLNLPDAEHGATSREFIATTVLRKQANGKWKALIDNPIGPRVLSA